MARGFNPPPLHKALHDPKGWVDPLWRGWYDTLSQRFNTSSQITTGSTATSPFTYINQSPSGSPGQVVATVHFYITSAIGNVSAVAISRDAGATFVTLPIQTMYTISGGDELKVTHSGTLTYTVVPQ